MDLDTVKAVVSGINLRDALISISGKSMIDRSSGLNDLKRCFDPKNRASWDSLSDKAFNKIFDVLFQNAYAEKKLFLDSKRGTTQKASLRLSANAEVIQNAVRAGAGRLKRKTVETAIKKMTDVVLLNNGQYCEPLTNGYLKALCAILEYPPNVEHLSEDSWGLVADFCLTAIESYYTGHDPSTSMFSLSHGESTPDSRAHTPARQFSSATEGSVLKRDAEVLIQCLHFLVSSPNGPIIENARRILSGVTHFIHSQGLTIGPLHQVTFAIINILVATTSIDDISLAQSIGQEMMPVIARLWSSKVNPKDEMLNAAKDEMLVTLLTTHLHMERLLKDRNVLLERKIRELRDTLSEEYSRRQIRDQLQIDDLDLTHLSANATTLEAMGVHSFSLKPHTPRAERNWALLQVLGIYERLLLENSDLGLGDSSIEAEHNEGRHSRKRRKVAQASDDLNGRLKSLDFGQRLTTLQLLPFTLQRCQLSPEALNELLSNLVKCTLDKREDIASWAMLAITSCAYQISASNAACSFDWVQLWHSGARLITMSTTCRVGAHMLHVIVSRNLVRFRDIAEAVNAIFTSTDLSGPATLWDTSLSLLTHLLHLRNTEVATGSTTARYNTIRWVSSKWNPLERSFLASQARHTHPIDILNLIRTALGLPRLRLQSPVSFPSETIGQAWRIHLSNEEVLRFLLLLETPPKSTIPCSSCPEVVSIHETPRLAEKPPNFTTKKMMLDLLLPRFGELSSSLQTHESDQGNQLTQEALRCFISSCILGNLLLPLLSDSVQAGTATDLLDVYVQDLGRSICKILSGVNRDQSIDEVILQELHPYLPSSDTASLIRYNSQCAQLLPFMATISSQLHRHHLELQESNGSSSIDLMDMDYDFESQQSRTRQDNSVKLARRDCSATITRSAFYTATAMQLMLLSTIWNSTDFVPSISSSFVNYLTELNSNELVLSREAIVLILQSDLPKNTEDAFRFLRHIGEIMMEYDHECCEPTLLLCLDVIRCLAPMWLLDENSELANAATDFYEWFIKVVLSKRRTSPGVLVGLSDLLYRLLFLKDNFGEDLQLPSVRTSLFEILNKGPSKVKFSISGHLAEIFNLFVLKYHDAILSDLLACLPEDPSQIEGIAFRMHVLVQLASCWSSLLRRCMYHIFEIPASVPLASRHAKRCLLDLSRALNLEKPQALFRLFSSQILYTWLDDQAIEDIPYEVFGYRSLRELLKDMQAEATALMIMRNHDEGVKQLAATVGLSMEDLLSRSFSKVLGYSIANDISHPHPDGATRYITGEVRLKKLLGKETFFQYVNRNFTEIMAVFFQTLDHDRQVEKIWSKAPELSYAASILTEMKALGSSDQELPSCLEPAFKPKYLPREIDHLCGRMNFEVDQLYTPTMIVFIARKLLDTIHPALGPQHACSVIRKLRVLIALAGKEVLQGYPLEMLLHSLRPFVTSSECVDDALGIVQYLFQHGSDYLSQSPSFVAGVSVSLLVSLRIFMESSQQSTTQDTVQLETLSRAQKFHKWLGRWLADYKSPQLTGSSQQAFTSMVKSAHGIRTVGNAAPETFESNLLLEILDDDRSGRHLLNKPSRDLAFTLLCADFELPESFRGDILGSNDRALDYAPTLWKLCRNENSSESFLAWAGRVFGRAFASTGQVESQLLQESDLSQTLSANISSRGRILQLLQGLTLGDSPHNAGLAEAALRRITSSIEGSPEAESEDYQTVSESLLAASMWAPYHVAHSDELLGINVAIEGSLFDEDAITHPDWVRNLTIALARSVPVDPVLEAVSVILQDVNKFAQNAFPFVLHLVLSSQLDGQEQAKRQVSGAIRRWLQSTGSTADNNLRRLINAVLYLRTQPLPRERSSADRLQWLDIDYSELSKTALRCGMFKTALLFAEAHLSETSRTSRRTSSIKASDQSEVLLSIFKDIDDPDVFYGVQQESSLGSILARLEHERDGLKSLSFLGAQYDNHLRCSHPSTASDAQSLISALGMLSLDGLGSSLLQTQSTVDMSKETTDNMFRAARKLEQWDVPVPATSDATSSATIYSVFQSINTVSDRSKIVNVIDHGLRRTISDLVKHNIGANQLRPHLQSLAILTEIDEIFSSTGISELGETIERFQERSSWMKTGRFEDVSNIISCRETSLSSLSRGPQLRSMLSLSMSESRLCEVQTLLLSSSLHRAHGALQESLVSATRLTGLVESCKELGLEIEAAIHMEAASALWEQGEIVPSIGMLKVLESDMLSKRQTIAVGKSPLLARIGYQVSVARLEKPDRIMEKYLTPALRELKGEEEGSEAGQVFHEFAAFCDKQLQDVDNLADLERLHKLKQMKDSEVADLTRMYKNASNDNEKARYRSHLSKAKQWLELDNQEYRRLAQTRDDFLRQSLENYLLALTASDEHNNDALRFTSLWLEHSNQDLVNDAVSKHLQGVPTRKFAALMNQLSSRLLENQSKFQQLLFSLISRICTDHPYHGMYQIWTGYKSRSNTKDGNAVSRQTATKKVARLLSETQETYNIWTAIDHTNKVYCQLAGEKYKAGQRPTLKESSAANNLNNLLQRYHLPSPTMQVEISPAMNYDTVPVMVKLENQISIASGVSAPKIITVIASDGVRYKQLVKGGNDDLRQDAIMEQVFSQVSGLLKSNRATRQRNLGIRTYKVLPLTSMAGIIEFVPNTIPLHEYLMPAHERYYPKDLKGSQCRKEITEVQQQKLESRVKRFKSVTERFHPVMRYFFTEKFEDPDEWFDKRLAYTRSTAAISILGHILGLGDRHGHNILLDEKTGEAVHIDLGVAFEMGRVLPVPEVVPFRLTRDIVDGMGITKTEGVFRRCCEFTLEALRKESYSIMTILDVLRYDPLYSWSISPVRLAKLQDAQSAAPVAATTTDGTKSKGVLNEPSEADRALTVVNKKLSKTLSVTATVNDLINQATDERNLAVLYSGWAAYA